MPSSAMRAKTVFEMRIPYLEEKENSGGGSSPNMSTTVRGTTSEYLRASRVSSPISSGASARYEFTAGVGSALNTPAAAATTGTVNVSSGGGGGSALTKPVIPPGSIRCCSHDQWVPDAHVVNCMAPGCSTSFSLFNRKYHCKICGRVFCSSCCSAAVTIPNPNGVSSANAAFNSSSGAGAGGGGGGYGIPNSSIAPRSGGASGRRGGEGGGGADTPLPNVGGAAAMNDPAASNSLTYTASFNAGGVGFAAPDTTAAPSSASAAPMTYRVCNGCRYELHLVVSRRQDSGEVRRKSRGELKMLQWALVVNILGFLPLRDLLETALVSADFYFMSKDNLVWYQYNMMRWAKDAEQTQTQLSLASTAPASTGRRWGSGGVGRQESTFEASRLLQDATALTESEAAKRVVSLHARYNYTQFLDFTRRQEMARCEGMSSFSVGARILFSSPVKVALIGPRGVRKTASIREFLGHDRPGALGSTATGTGSSSPSHRVYPTTGFTRHIKTVRLAGGLATDVTLHIYDLSGAPRYEALRRFICAQCHAIGLCYDPTSKVTLVEAADVMMDLETALGPQPVVVCGLLPKGTVGSQPGSAGRYSRRLALATHHNGSSLASSMASVPPSMNGCTASGGGEFMAEECGRAAQTDEEEDAGATPGGGHLAVSEEDAIGITVRTAGSLQCPVDQCEPFYHKLLQCLIDRLATATMAGTATVADITGDLAAAGGGGSAGQQQQQQHGSAAADHSVLRRPTANKVVAQELLNLTMQPCAMDILLDRK